MNVSVLSRVFRRRHARPEFPLLYLGSSVVMSGYFLKSFKRELDDVKKLASGENMGGDLKQGLHGAMRRLKENLYFANFGNCNLDCSSLLLSSCTSVGAKMKKNTPRDFMDLLCEYDTFEGVDFMAACLSDSLNCVRYVNCSADKRERFVDLSLAVVERFESLVKAQIEGGNAGYNRDNDGFFNRYMLPRWSNNRRKAVRSDGAAMVNSGASGRGNGDGSGNDGKGHYHTMLLPVLKIVHSLTSDPYFYLESSTVSSREGGPSVTLLVSALQSLLCTLNPTLKDYLKSRGSIWKKKSSAYDLSKVYADLDDIYIMHCETFPAGKIDDFVKRLLPTDDGAMVMSFDYDDEDEYETRSCRSITLKVLHILSSISLYSPTSLAPVIPLVVGMTHYDDDKGIVEASKVIVRNFCKFKGDKKVKEEAEMKGLAKCAYALIPSSISIGMLWNGTVQPSPPVPYFPSPSSPHPSLSWSPLHLQRINKFSETRSFASFAFTWAFLTSRFRLIARGEMYADGILTKPFSTRLAHYVKSSLWCFVAVGFFNQFYDPMVSSISQRAFPFKYGIKDATHFGLRNEYIDNPKMLSPLQQQHSDKGKGFRLFGLGFDGFFNTEPTKEGQKMTLSPLASPAAAKDAGSSKNASKDTKAPPTQISMATQIWSECCLHIVVHIAGENPNWSEATSKRGAINHLDKCRCLR